MNRRGIRGGTEALILAVIIVACSPTASTEPSGIASNAATQGPESTAPTSGSTPAPSPDRAAGWRADIAAIVPDMARIHPDLFHGTSQAELDAAAAALAASVDTATDDQLLVGVVRLAALVSRAGCDAHTGAYIWGTGTHPLESLPLRLWLFGDEVRVVDALPPYQDLVGARIDSIGPVAIADVLAALTGLIPRDNDQTVRLLTPRFLLIPQVLRGLGIIDADPDVGLGLTHPGHDSAATVAPITMAAYNAWAGPYGLHLPANPAVLYLSRIDDALWWQLLPDGETLFVQYNRVDHLPTSQYADLDAAMHAPGVARIVLDLRHNYGGELSALDPIDAIFADPAFDQPSFLYAATGRNTFSAGSLLVARLQRDTAAEIVGEPMGGCPTFWSDPTELTLPYSGIAISVADDVAVGVDPDDPRDTIEPDVPVELTADDWRDGVDPILDAFVTTGP